MRRLFDPCAFDFSKKYVKEWNESIEKLTNNERLVTALQNFYDRQNSIGALKQFLFQIVSKLDAKCTTIEVKDVTKLIDQLIGPEDTAKLVAGLSVLEICLLISIKHHCDIYDNEPFNFEIIFARFCKFAIKSTTMQNIEREMALKRFENLKVRPSITLKFPRMISIELNFHSIKNSSRRSEPTVKSKRNTKCIELWSYRNTSTEPFNNIRICRLKLSNGRRVRLFKSKSILRQLSISALNSEINRIFLSRTFRL